MEGAGSLNHHQPNRFAPKARTIADITLDLDMWLVNSRPHAFHATTLEELQRRYGRLNPRLVECKLLAAQQRRKGEEAGTVEPQRCSACDGSGTVWRYRLDDQRYPTACPKCRGKGVA